MGPVSCVLAYVPMDYTLRKILFTEAALSLPQVQDFDCGIESWALDVANDLKNPNCVAAWVGNGTAEAWLYVTDKGELAGFGVLSGRYCRYPNPKKSPKQPISVIADVAVHMQFHHQPNVPGVKNYSNQILDHLRFEARRHTERLPILGLMVHPANTHAIRWYQNTGFVRLADDWIDPDTKVAYWRMALDIG